MGLGLKLGLQLGSVLGRSSSLVNQFYTDDAMLNEYYTDDAMLNPLDTYGVQSAKYVSPATNIISHDSETTIQRNMSRIVYINLKSAPITTARVFYGTWLFNATSEYPTGKLEVRAGLEYPLGGTIYPLYSKQGSRDLFLASNSEDYLEATGINIPAGASFAIRTRAIAGTGGTIPKTYANNLVFNGVAIQGHAGTNDGSDFTLGGTQPTNSNTVYGPFAVCSYETTNKAKSFAIFGDSIYQGNIVGVSIAESAIKNASCGFLNLARSGAKLQGGANPSRRISLARLTGCTEVMMNYPVNDLEASRSVAQIKADFTSLWTNLKTAGFSKITQGTCFPRTTDATDPSTPKSTPAGAYTGGAASFRSLINEWMRSGISLGTATTPDYIFEQSDILETARDTGLWLNPTVNTYDGIHPSATGATTVATAGTTFLQSKGY